MEVKFYRGSNEPINYKDLTNDRQRAEYIALSIKVYLLTNYGGCVNVNRALEGIKFESYIHNSTHASLLLIQKSIIVNLLIYENIELNDTRHDNLYKFLESMEELR